MPLGGFRGSVAEGFRERNRPHLAAAILQAGELAHFGAVAVVRRIGADDAAPAGGEPRHQQRHFVRFRAGAGEDHALDASVVAAGQPFGVVEDALVQIAAVDVQRGRLAADRLHDMRMAMADAGHVVVHVHVAPPALVEHGNTFAAHDVQRLAVEERRPGAEQRVATFLESSGHQSAPASSTVRRLRESGVGRQVRRHGFRIVGVAGLGSQGLGEKQAASVCCSAASQPAWQRG